MTPKVIVLFGRRWHDKNSGSTYHDVEIIAYGHGKSIHHRTSMSSGGMEMYIQTAAEWLNDQKIISLTQFAHGGKEGLRNYCRDHNIKLFVSVVDVSRQKDLKQND